MQKLLIILKLDGMEKRRIEARKNSVYKRKSAVRRKIKFYIKEM